MDIGAFVEENKRWLLGCAFGVVVFFVLRGVLGAFYDAGQPLRQARAVVGSVPAEIYDQAALDAARQEAEALGAEKQRLVAELAYRIDPAYRLEGHGSPDAYLGRVGRELKLRLLRAADERDIELQDKDLRWPSPTNPDEIRSVLFGLELIDVACQRLFAVHDAVRSAVPEASGLVGMQLGIEERRTQRGPVRGRPGEVDVRDLLDQERVTFTLQCDAATAVAFVEACRSKDKPLVLETLSMLRPQRRGDPLTVKGSFTGIAFREEAK